MRDLWTCPDCLSLMPVGEKDDHKRHHPYANSQSALDAELNGPNSPTQEQIYRLRIAELEALLREARPWIVLRDDTLDDRIRAALDRKGEPK